MRGLLAKHHQRNNMVNHQNQWAMALIANCNKLSGRRPYLMDGLLVLFGTCFHECWVACILTDEETFAVMWHLLFHTCKAIEAGESCTVRVMIVMWKRWIYSRIFFFKEHPKLHPMASDKATSPNLHSWFCWKTKEFTHHSSTWLQYLVIYVCVYTYIYS